MANRTFTEVLPLLIPIESRLAETIVAGSNVDFQIIDIADVISDPANPVPDFPTLTVGTRAWVLAWSVRIDTIAMGGFAGTNRTGLFLQVRNLTNARALLERSQDGVQLSIPATAGSDNYVYTGSRVIHSKQARVNIENLTGDTVILDIDIWAKAW